MQLKKSLALILVLALSLVVLTACDNAAKPTVVGTWELDAAAQMTAEQKAQLEPTALDALKMTFTFSADGKMTVASAGQEMPAGAYTVSGDKITMDVNGSKSEATYSISGDKLSLTLDGETQVLTKK